MGERGRQQPCGVLTTRSRPWKMLEAVGSWGSMSCPPEQRVSHSRISSRYAPSLSQTPDICVLDGCFQIGL